jgi:hypothetical protein
LAIKTIWIIDGKSGICIFDWYAKEEDYLIDEQLIAGLLIAFRDFSSEAGLVDISAIEGVNKKLAYFAGDRFIIAAICNSRDYEPLVNSTLEQILKLFKKEFSDQLKDEAAINTNIFQDFSKIVIKQLEGKSAPRTTISAVAGGIASLFIVGAVFTVAFLSLGPIATSIDQSSANIILFIELLIGMFLGGFIGGIIAGERQKGMIVGVVSVFPIIILLIILMNKYWGSISDKIFYPLLYLVIFSAMTLLGGLYGGYLKEKRFFFEEPEQVPQTS